MDQINKFGDLNSESILSIKDLIAWKRSKKSYNFDTLPELAIIGPSINLSKNQKYLQSKKIKGLLGKHRLYKSKILFSTDFGIGAPAIITLLEELLALGVKKFIFIGVAGILRSAVKEGRAYIINKAYSTVGTTFFYSTSELCPDKVWFKKIKTQLNLKSAIAWSTDCPFRETSELVEYHKALSCDFVDMEVAGLYAFAEFYKIPIVCILIGADDLCNGIWKSPKDISSLNTKKRELIKTLLKVYG